MKWLLILFSIFKPFFSSEAESINPVTEIKDMVRANAMKALMFFAVATSLAILFSAGLVLVAVDMGAQYDQNGYIYFSSMIMMGLILSAISLVTGTIIIRSFQESDEPKKQSHLPLTAVGTSHPLQDALALLIADFVKERELKRSMELGATNEKINSRDTTEDMRH